MREDDWAKTHGLIVSKVRDICEEIAEKGEHSQYIEIFDMIFEEVEDKNLHLKEEEYD